MLTKSKLQSFVDLLKSDESVQESLLSFLPKVMAMKNDGDQFPLHVACEENAHPSIIEFVADIYPEACTSHDVTPFVPLVYSFHDDFIDTPNMEAVDALLKIAPRAVMAPADDGDNAFLIACSQRPFNPELLQKLLDACPEAVRSMTHIQETPLYSLFWRRLDDKISLDLVRLLFDLFPASIRLPETEHNFLPLHMACYYGTASVEMIDYLVEQYPEGIKARTFAGELPLHLAAQARAPFAVLKRLIEHYPDAVYKVTGWRRFPLHLYCESEDSVSRDDFVGTLNRLISYFPVAAIQEDVHSKIPLDLLLDEEDGPEDFARHLEEVERDAACAMLECALTRTSSIPRSSRTRIAATLPLRLRAIAVTRIDGIALFESVRKHSLEWYRDRLRGAIRSSLLQRLIRKTPYHRMACGIYEMNRAGRHYVLTDPYDREAAVRVFLAVANNLDCIFLHLTENPSLCELLLTSLAAQPCHGSRVY